MTTSYVESETIPSESFLEPRRYRVTYQCARCGHSFKRTVKVVPKDDPPCPRKECQTEIATAALRQENERLRAMLESGQGPAHIGANAQVRAIDATSEIVMKDFGLTDLKDNIREGETAAPKLPPVQQAAADSYFSGEQTQTHKALDFGTGKPREISKRQWDLIGRRALAGAYRGMSVNPKVIAPDAVAGQPPLRLVRSEKV